MRLLDISTDLGPGATPASLEAILKGLRAATDVARDAETRRIRRHVSEQMKYPTDDELRMALERLPTGDELSPRYRAQQQLTAREFAWSESRRLPPDLWFEYLYRRKGTKADSSSFRALSDAGYDRFVGAVSPFVGTMSLDVLDPILYDALVADELARSLPDEVGVSDLRYTNPFWTRFFGKGRAEKTLSTTVEVIEVARDFGSKRKIIKAEASVADATIDNRIVESDLDVALKREKLREAQLGNERLAIENAGLHHALDGEQQRRQLIAEAVRRGHIDIADALRALDPGDIAPLADLGRRRLETVDHWEPDEPGE